MTYYFYDGQDLVLFVFLQSPSLKKENSKRRKHRKKNAFNNECNILCKFFNNWIKPILIGFLVEIIIDYLR